MKFRPTIGNDLLVTRCDRALDDMGIICRENSVFDTDIHESQNVSPLL